MTPDMKFEALLVSPNLHLLKGVLETLEDLSIDVDICTSPTRAVEVLTKRNVDLVVIDCAKDKDSGAAEVARTLARTSGRRKTTIVALVEGASAGKQVTEAGAHVLIQKPLTTNFRSDFRKLVYSRMVWEWRKQPRYAVRWLVAAKDANDKPVPVTMEDISRVGVGLSFVGKLHIDDILKFRVMLPGTYQIIQFEGRILWTLRDHRAGAEFVKISTVDSDVLHEWLQSKHKVKKLATERAMSFSGDRELGVL
jgi:CheY-like chemotaxis protein